MRFGADWLHIGGFINTHMPFIMALLVLSVISAVLCLIISLSRKQIFEDVVFATIFGLVFNVLGLLFVIFRKPVWNNLGWVPVIIAWFFIDGNLLFAIILAAYAVIWAFSQNALLKRIEVVKD